MSCEDREIPQEVNESTPSPVDANRAFRELQRWLNIDDQMRPYGRRELPPLSNEDRGKLICTIVYNPDKKTIKYKRPKTEPSGEIEP